MNYQERYAAYLSQASAALDAACNEFLPEESEVCRAARYSLLGGGKRIRAVLVLSTCEMLGGDEKAAQQFAENTLEPTAAELDETHVFPVENFKQMAIQ